MSTVWAIVRRELHAYFVSPIAYVVIVVFLLISAFGFARALELYANVPEIILEERGFNLRTFVMARTVFWTSLAMILALPALSMRLFSEERKAGTAELLLTSPLTTMQLVLGKYFGACAVLAIMLVATLAYPVALEWQADPEWPAIGAAYFGLFLFGALILAIGVFASSLTENQIVALLLTYAIYLPLWLLQLLVGFLGPPWDDIFAATAVSYGLQSMGLGLIDSHFVMLFVVLSGLFLFLCSQVLDSNRWR